jgi:membrane-bound lytic murein transglycosylase D
MMKHLTKSNSIFLSLTALTLIFLFSIIKPSIAYTQVETGIPPEIDSAGIRVPEQDSLEINGMSLLNDSTEAGKIIEDTPVIGMLDSLEQIKYFKDYYFKRDSSMTNVYNFMSDEVPNYDDSTYSARIEKLSQETPIELSYNTTVRNYIELYAIKKRELTSRVLGLKEIYFPLIEEYLDKYDLPLEFKYLAVVESALNPVANSRAGARGIWQFMYGTGKLYGLKVTSMIDERYDPYLATDAACRHLRDLYSLFGDWNLVMAAYNSGAGNVSKAIRRAGGVKNYWAIWPFLPRETRGYIPAFIAVVYVMNYTKEHNLYPIDPGILYNGIDTVIVKEPLAFDQISEILGLSNEELRFLNPMYKNGIIPSYNGKIYPLRLPVEYIGPYIDNETALYNYKSKSGLEKEKLLTEIKKASDRSVHTVHGGETLGSIAREYHVTVDQLKQWNGMRGTMIHPGQQLVIFPPYSASTAIVTQPAAKKGSGAVATQAESPAPPKQDSATASKTGHQYHVVEKGENLPATKPVSENTKKIIYYTVKKGDSLWQIAQQYPGVTVSDLKSLNNLNSSSRLQPGQKLKIAIDG